MEDIITNIVLLSIFLPAFLGSLCSCRVYQRTLVSDENFGKGTLQSPGFPKSYADSTDAGNEYLYIFLHRHSDDYVRIVFSDFSLHESSSLILYEGNTTKPVNTYTYTNNNRPIYQSFKHQFSLRFLPGDSADDSVFYGFKADYYFVQQTRLEWKESGMPGKGLCPKVTGEKGHIKFEGSVRSRNSIGDNFVADCVWLLQSANVPSTVHLIILDASLHDALFKVHNGPHSLSPVVFSVPHEPLQLAWRGIASAFYITFTGHLSDSDRVEFIYAPNSEEFEDLITKKDESQEPSDEMLCPFSKCKETSECIAYWERCLPNENNYWAFAFLFVPLVIIILYLGQAVIRRRLKERQTGSRHSSNMQDDVVNQGNGVRSGETALHTDNTSTPRGNSVITINHAYDNQAAVNGMNHDQPSINRTNIQPQSNGHTENLDTNTLNILMAPPSYNECQADDPALPSYNEAKLMNQKFIV